MRPVKRLEIIMDSLQLRRLVNVLEETGVTGYTVLPNARGRGRRGLRAADELTDALKNVYVLVACPEEQSQRVLDALRPILRRFGGICIVSDAAILEGEDRPVGPGSPGD